MAFSLNTSFLTRNPVAGPVPTPPSPTAAYDQTSGIINNAIPGYSGLSKGASDVVGKLLGGLPSAGPTQRANAYFGANSGMPGSDFVRNRGFDLYGEKADSYKQRGFDDFLNLLKGVSGTVAPTAGQQIQSGQFQQDLAQRQRESNANLALQQQKLAMTNDSGGIYDTDPNGNTYNKQGAPTGYQARFDYNAPQNRNPFKLI